MLSKTTIKHIISHKKKTNYFIGKDQLIPNKPNFQKDIPRRG